MAGSSVISAQLAEGVLGAPDGSFVLAEWTDAGESSRDSPIAPLHAHLDEDEAWYVLDGVLGFRIGDDEVVAERGTAVVVPGGTPHTYWNGVAPTPGARAIGRAWDHSPTTSSSSPSAPATATRSHYDAERSLVGASRFGGTSFRAASLRGCSTRSWPRTSQGREATPRRRWSFKAPVRPGDEITAEVEVLEAREDKPITRFGRR